MTTTGNWTLCLRVSRVSGRCVPAATHGNPRQHAPSFIKPTSVTGLDRPRNPAAGTLGSGRESHLLRTFIPQNEPQLQVLKKHSSHRSIDVLFQNTRTEAGTWKLDARGGTPAGDDGESLSHPPSFRGTCNLPPLS